MLDDEHLECKRVKSLRSKSSGTVPFLKKYSIGMSVPVLPKLLKCNGKDAKWTEGFDVDLNWSSAQSSKLIHAW